MKYRTRLLSGAVLTAGLLALCLGIVTSAEVSRPAAVFDRVIGLASLPDLESISRLPDLRRLLDRRTIRAAASAAQDPAPAATVKTDKGDYHPFEIVQVSGAGWQPDETVELVFKEDPWFADQEEVILYAVAEPDGTIFNDKFVTDFHDAGITFTLIATGKLSSRVASTTFTDAATSSGDLDQCANADAGNPACAGGGTSWQNGNLNDNQADYLEGDSVPYRLKLSNLALTHPVTGTPLVHRVTIAWDTTKGNKHALDYITTYNRTVLLADPCSEIPGDHCDATKQFDTENIPLDPRVAAGPDGVPGNGDDIIQIPGVFTLFGGTITAITFPPTVSPQPGSPTSPYAIATSSQCSNNNGTYADDSTTCVTIDFVTTVTNPVLAWAGHIATRKDWGANLSAIAIPGSPYHTRFTDLDGSGGNQDRSLSAGAVFFPASLTIIKETNPSPDSTEFTFPTTGADLPASFTLNTSSVGTTDRQTFSLTDSTVRTVTEQGPPSGWTFTSLTCTVTADPLLAGTGGTATVSSQTATITPKEGDTIECKYVNTKRPKLTVTKVLLPSTDSGLFDLKINGTTHVTDVGDGGSTGSQIANIGSNSFGETAGTGTSLSDYVTTISGTGCSDNGDGTGSITLAAGDDKTCTITNKRKGSIVIVKDAQPNDPTDFKFTAGGGLSPALFFLDDDAEGTLSNTRTFSSLAPGSGYSVSESVPGGWTQASASCDDGSDPSNIDVSAGETVTCTFTNTKKPRLTVVKVLAPASDSGKFNLQINGTTHATDVGDTGTTGAQEGIVGSNSFGETAGAGTSLADYVKTISGAGCSDNGDGTGAITLAAGDDKTCTITNTRKGTIVVVKDANPDDPTDFKFGAGGGLSPALFFLDDDADGTLSNTQTFSGLAPGATYSVSESVPDGWVQTSATCSDGSPISAIDVSAGETVTCTFVNTKKPRLTVVKALVPASDSGKFNLLINGTSHATDVGDAGTTGAQYGTIGSNSFGETAGTGTSLSDYVTTISGTGCSDNGDGTGAITLAAGDDKTCTITNTRKGKIVVVKDANPDDPTDFKFGAGGGLSPALFFLDDDADGTLPNTQTFSGLAPGAAYSVAESVPDGWVQTSATCSDGSPISAIDVSAGETVTCTFVNTKKPKLTVVKALVPASDSGKFNLLINGDTHATDVGDTGTTGAQYGTIGSNSFGETAGTATSLADYVKTISGTGCSDNGDGTGAITLAAGDDKTCTITNTRKGTIVVVKDANPDDPTDFKFGAGGGLSPALFFLDDDADGTLPNTQTFSGLAPGATYSVAESVPDGWVQTSATCSDGSPISAIDVSAGETVTCTFVNTKKPKLTVVKVLVPAADSGKFNLKINGTTYAGDVGNGGTTGPQSATIGSNSFGETAGTATSLADYVKTISGDGCSDNGDGTGAITLAAGDDKTCTITNTRKGTIVVVKDANPDDPTDFKFGAGGGLSPALFFLDDDADGTLPNTQTFSGLAPGATYSVSESVPDGWVQTSATCSDGSPISAIDVSAGETVTCTFVNTKNATVTVKKVMVGGTADFPFTGTPNGTISTSGGTITASVAPGTYYSTEGVVAGWDLTSIVCDDTDSTVNLGSLKATFKVGAGEKVTCTFTNTKRGGIVVKKATIPSGATGSFTFTGKAAGTIGDGGEIAVPNLIPGTYYSTESNPTPAFDLTKIVCNDTDSSVDLVTRKATFVVAAGETVTCTFTNTQRGKAKVIKTASGAAPSGTQAFTFQLRSGASAIASGTTLETVIANAANGGLLSFTTNLVPGQSYQMCEIVMPGWNTTLGEFVPDSFIPPDGVAPNPMVDNSILCVNFTVTAGETKTFTVNNTPPPGGRALTIGFWKNWASCAKSSGGQKPVLDQVLASFPINFFYVIPGSLTPATTHGIWLGRVFVDTCQEAVALLNKSTIVGLKKKASDPLFNMAAQLMAAVLNVQAGAGICPNNLLAIQNAHALLYKYSFNGTTYSPKLTAADANKANQLAAYLDAYNNTTACPAVPPPS